MKRPVIFLGGPSGAGKSTLAQALADQEGWLSANAFSALMQEKLPHVQDHRTILSGTSVQERAAARRHAARQLMSMAGPTLVTGHYASCRFLRDGQLDGVELAFPPELLELTSGLAFAEVSNLRAVLRRRDARVPSLGVAQVRVEQQAELAVYKYLITVSRLPHTTVPMGGKKALPTLRRFVRRLRPTLQ